MYQKKKLAFSNRTIFEKFSPSIDRCFCVVAKMMFANRINIDGSIDMSQAGFLKKNEVWSYIYYLFYYNNTTLEEFATMRDEEKGKASAIRFYEVVKAVVQNQFIADDKVVPLDINTLIYFVNAIVHKYGENMKNPVVDYLISVLDKHKGVTHLNKLSVITGTNASVVAEPEKVANANVKVSFQYK